MPVATSTTRWRDQPIVPRDYGDINSLIKIAREARHRVVEFDWIFIREDLLRLRRAVYEWGIGVVGRYRCFDARMLAVINDALGDPDPTFLLREPKNSKGTDCIASCVAEGESFRLRGHATFDIVFGYGSAGVAKLTGSAYLGATAQKALADAVGMLGWDLRRLNDERYLAVRNALYGLPVNRGFQEKPLTTGMAVDHQVHFYGPFSAIDGGACPCLFTNEMAKGTGVYLWTVNIRGKERPWYVGQTRRSFGQRMGEHIAAFLSGQYPTYDVAALLRGEYRRATGFKDGVWPEMLPSFLRNFESLVPNITELMRVIRFHVAPLDRKAQLHDRVEGAIGRYYKAHVDPDLRDFFSPGLKIPVAIPYDTPVRLVFSSETPIAGLPPHLQA